MSGGQEKMKPTKGTDDQPILTYPFKVHQPQSPATNSDTVRVFQKSVTLHAYMEGYPRSTDGSLNDTGWFLWGITEAQLPIVVGAAAGGLVLILTLFGLVVWRFCQRQKCKEKQYCLKKCEEERQQRHAAHQNFSKRSSNDSVVYVGTASKSSVLKQTQYHLQHEREQQQQQQHPHQNHHHHHHHHHRRHHHHSPQSCYPVPDQALDCVTGSSDKSETESNLKVTCISRSQSAPVKAEKSGGTLTASTKKRPQSQPIQCSSVTDVTDASRPNQSGNKPQSHNPYSFDDKALPGIPEIRLQSSETLDSEPQSCYYNTTDHPITKRQLQVDVSSATLKTRSLPAWVRSRPRPLSTEDDLNELYAKVNFNKKRKNRMRNDSAAAIALNKSRSQFIHFPFMHKDTDSLVDNEAVVVFDERTAL